MWQFGWREHWSRFFVKSDLSDSVGVELVGKCANRLTTLANWLSNKLGYSRKNRVDTCNHVWFRYSYFPAIALTDNWLLVLFVEPFSFQGPLHLGGFHVIVCMCLLCCCRWVGLFDPSHAVHFGRFEGNHHVLGLRAKQLKALSEIVVFFKNWVVLCFMRGACRSAQWYGNAQCRGRLQGSNQLGLVTLGQESRSGLWVA